MPVEFYRPLAHSGQFPKTVYAATPKFRFSELCWQSKVPKSSAMLFTQSGRTALAIAGQQLKRDSNVILVPGYHSPSVIEPFIWLNYQCVFYRVNPDLSPDLGHIEQLFGQHEISHCLLINYFGVAGFASSFIALMQAREIIVIYDCAHALFKVLDSAPETGQADATICSINKLLPSIDGGIVVLKERNRGSLTAVPMWPEIKAVSYLFGLTKLVKKLINMLKYPCMQQLTNDHNSGEPSAPAEFRYFMPQQVEQRCFSHTIALLTHTNLALIRQRRRDNYLYLLELLNINQPANGHALFGQLAANDVPYVFPYLLNNPQGFTRLRQAGIQSLRWEEMAQTDCAISNHYRHCLVQLPCHHQLTQSDLRAMATTISNI